jgi:hypothetical protein
MMAEKMGNPTKEGRQRIFRLSRISILKLIDWNPARDYGQARPRIKGIPADAYISAIHEDYMTSTLVFTVDSMEFSPVLPGNQIPEMTVCLDWHSPTGTEPESEYLVARRETSEIDPTSIPPSPIEVTDYEGFKRRIFDRKGGAMAVLLVEPPTDYQRIRQEIQGEIDRALDVPPRIPAETGASEPQVNGGYPYKGLF